jgi:cytochrome c oxidase assembly protein subunit 11
MTALGRNGRTALVLSGVVAGMVGLSFASVPLYKLFCQVTGYGGTTQRAEQGADRVVERMVTVRFNADTARDMPWVFRPVQRQIEVKVGENHLAYYRAENRTSQTIVGTATFNVTPAKAGLYFSKIDCFCFTEQVLKPGESVEMPVSFFVDPAIVEDRNLDEVKTITLSYTFFRAPTPEPARTSALAKDSKLN